MLTRRIFWVHGFFIALILAMLGVCSLFYTDALLEPTLSGSRSAMILNAVETLLVNNPMRALVQRFYEVPLLCKLGGSLEGACVLEVGCGRGTGVQILLEQVGIAKVCAIDVDPGRSAGRSAGSQVTAAAASRSPPPASKGSPIRMSLLTRSSTSGFYTTYLSGRRRLRKFTACSSQGGDSSSKK